MTLPFTSSVSPLTFVSQWLREVSSLWNSFWFKPAQPHTLACIRILAGAMLLYTHLVWTLDLNAFLGERAWIDTDTALRLGTTADGANYTWSYLWYVKSPGLIWILHIWGLVALGCFTVGFQTRWAAIISFIFTLSYCHRLTGMQFGLDQVNAMLVTYLMLAPSGDAYSVDRWLAARRGESLPAPAVMSNLAIRLIQCHMCIIYLFGGISKMRGELWWDGSALWFAAANLEYQSLSLTWLANLRWLVALLTLSTMFWEATYAFFIWFRLSRWLYLSMAIMVHGGIAIFLGMKTFGLAMLIGNLAFVEPQLLQSCLGWMSAGRKPSEAV